MSVLQSKVTHYSAQLGEAHDKEPVVVAGIVVRVRPYQTRAGKPMGFVTLEDIQGNIELVLFPRTWEKYSSLFDVDKVLSVEGKVDAQSGDPKILVDKVAVETPGTAAETSGMGKLAPAARPEPPKETPAAEDEGLDWPDAAVSPDEPPDWMDSGTPPDPADWELNASPPDEPTDAGLPPEVDQHAAVEVRQFSAPVAEVTVEQQAQAAAAQNGTMRAAESGAAFILAPFMVPVKTSPGQQDQPRMLTIDVRSSGDKKRDVLRLRCIYGVLVSNPGQDHFAFHIFEGGRGYLLEFPNETSGVTPELWERLAKLAGKENLHLDPIQVQ
jgi:DNA polymerase-3 subunit alpha